MRLAKCLRVVPSMPRLSLDTYYSTVRRLLWISIRKLLQTFCVYLQILVLADKCLIAVGLLKGSQFCYSTVSFDEDEAPDGKIEYDDFMSNKRELEPQGVDPKRGWRFRGVHKAIICGKIGQAPVQKILRNGRTVTIFTVGTGGMYDQRIVGAEHLPKPAQWHRIAVHNEQLEAYAVRELVKNSPVFVEGDIETRVYNDSISGEIKNIPEICVRRDGKIHLIKTGEGISQISLDEMRDGLF